MAAVAFSLFTEGALDLRRGSQGPALVASGKASPHASGSGASRDSSPVKAGASDLVRVRGRNLRFLSSADMDLGVLLKSPRGVSPRLEWGHARALPSCSRSVTLPFLWIKGSGVYLEAFP